MIRQSLMIRNTPRGDNQNYIKESLKSGSVLLINFSKQNRHKQRIHTAYPNLPFQVVRSRS